MQQLILSILIMYAVLAAAGVWYRRNKSDPSTSARRRRKENLNGHVSL